MLRAIILTDEPEAKKNEIVIREIDPKTLSAMIHYLYTGDLIEEALDVQMVAHAAAKYRIPGFMDLLCFKMKTEDVQSKFIADMLIAADRHGSQDLKNVALDKIRADREILNDKGFRKKMQEAENKDLLVDLFNDL